MCFHTWYHPVELAWETMEHTEVEVDWKKWVNEGRH